MKKLTTAVCALLLAGALCSALTGCGSGFDDTSAGGGRTSSPPTTVATAAGAIATDSWGYTGSNPTQLTAPAKTVVVLQEHTLLKDPFNVVISGISFTSVSYSTDATTLSPAQRASAPGTLVSYVALGIGFAKSATPAMSVTVDVTPVAAGETVKVSLWEPVTGKWVAPYSAVVDSTGKITFPADQVGLWGVFK